MLASANWYDVLVVVALVYGVWSGIRTGLSGEIIGLIGFVLMVALAAEFCTPFGRWLSEFLGVAETWSGLVGFVVIAGAMYLLTVVVRRAVHARFSKLNFAALLENAGGAFAGMVRMAVIMALVSIVASLAPNAWLHKNVAQDSRFGSMVVQRFPAVKSMVETNFPGNVWFLNDLKRREEPTPDAVETNKSR